MIPRIPIAVLGATAAGIGVALAHPEDVVIIDEGMLLAPEYVAGMNIKPFYQHSKQADAAVLYEQCHTLGLVDATGRPHIFPVQSLLARRIHENNISIRLYTTVTHIERTSDGWRIIIFDTEGFHTLAADRLVDTREQLSGQRNICAMLAGSDTHPPVLPAGCGAVLLKGVFASEYVLKLSLPTLASWPQARAALHFFWCANRPEGWQLASIAPCFVYDYEAPIVQQEPDGRLLCVSSAFGDLISAFEGGILCGCTL